MGWETWVGESGEVTPSLYAADFTRLGEQIDGASRGGLPDLPLRRRRRSLHPAGDDRACRPPVDRPDDPRRGRCGRLSPDGRRSGTSLSRVRLVGRRLGDLPRRGDGRPARRGGGCAGSRPRRRCRLQSGHRCRGRRRVCAGGGRRADPLHEHRARLLRAAVPAGVVRADRGARRARLECRSRSTVGSARTMWRPFGPPGRGCSWRAMPSSRDPDPVAAYRRIAAAAA